jgi:hypothetical protein
MDLKENDVGEFFKAFLIHSKGHFHENRSDKIQHFRNWLKKQNAKQTTNNNAKLGTSEARTEALRNW